jgi:hypothetical protein
MTEYSNEVNISVLPISVIPNTLACERPLRVNACWIGSRTAVNLQNCDVPNKSSFCLPLYAFIAKDKYAVRTEALVKFTVVCCCHLVTMFLFTSRDPHSCIIPRYRQTDRQTQQ